MKFCPNCGNQLEDSAIFCANCGTNVGAPVTTQNVIQDYNNLAVTQKNKKIGIIAVAASGALILILLFTLIFGGSGYEDAVDTLFAVTFEGDMDDIEDLAPEEFWDTIDEPIDDVIAELSEEYKEDLYEELIEVFGEDFDIDYEITDENELSSTKVKYVAESLNETYDIEENTVKEVYELDLEVVITGNNEERTRELEAYVVKIGSEWYPVECDFDDGEADVEFLVEDLF